MSTLHRIQPLSHQQCVERLTSVDLGRVVFTDRALPAILPVTFCVDDDSVVIRTARGSRLARAAEGAVLAFEVDDVQVGRCSGWSVVVTGEARIESDPVQRARLDAMLRAWVPGIKDTFIRIPLSVVTGRVVDGVPAA